MIIKAKEAGCWAVKFQLFTEKEAPNLPKHLYLTKERAKVIFEFGKGQGIEVFFTPMFKEAVEWCEAIRVNFYKIRYADNQNMGLILKILTYVPPALIFISLNPDCYPIEMKGTSYKKLLCVPEYPAKRYDYGLPPNFWTAYDGISDHTPDTAFMKELLHTDLWFEKHVKLDNNCIESDWSVTFEQLAEVLAL